MANIKPFVFLLLSSLLLVSVATASFEDKDPQVGRCKQQCKQQGVDKWQRAECRRRCEEKRQGGSPNIMEWNPQSPQERFQQCKQQCQSREQDRPECTRRCEETYRREQEQQGQGRDPQKQYEVCKQECETRSRQGQRQERERCEQRCEEELQKQQQEQGRPRNPTYGGEDERQQQQQGQESDNPYVFNDEHFQTSFQTQHGRLRVLNKFHRQSRLLRGLKNYRFAFLEANPQTFMRPHHCDSDNVIFVAQGRGTISMVREERRESLNIRRGDVLRIRAGTTVYMINSDNNEKLVVAKLVQPVNVPDSFEDFIPNLYFNALSTELLEAAFDTRGDKLQRFLGRQGQGQDQQELIIKASQEQIRGMSQHQQGGKWPFGESKGATNLFEERPKQSNQYGVLREISPNDYRELEDLDVSVSYINVTQGAMTTPYYNSRSTKISFVLNGQADMEMACPHLSSSEREDEQESQQGQRQQQQQGQSRPYKKVRAQLRRGNVLVVPAGHPVITVASGNQNLEMVCFEINTRNNERVPLAGRTNIWRNLEREAKELAFGIPSREVDSVLQNQKEEWFFRGPSQRPQQQEGRADE